MSDFSFILPANFSEYEREVETKGWFSEATIIVSGERYQLNFYDAARLEQEMADELERGGLFFESNLVVVRSVTGANMERAAHQLVKADRVKFLVPDSGIG